MLTTSLEITKIAKALLTFQGSVDGVGKDSANPHFKARYASLEAVHDTAVPALQAVGVVYLQIPGAIADGVMAMTTRLIHAESGQWIEGTGDIPLGKRDPQGAGSAQTYAQRYHLMAMLGLPSIDDDGETAIDRTNARPVPQAKPVAASDDEPEPMSNATAKQHFKTVYDDLTKCTTLKQLGGAWERHQPVIKLLPESMLDDLTQRKNEMKDLLAETAAAASSGTKPVTTYNFETLQP